MAAEHPAKKRRWSVSVDPPPDGDIPADDVKEGGNSEAEVGGHVVVAVSSCSRCGKGGARY